MRRTLFAMIIALTIVGCVNRVTSRKIASEPGIEIPIVVPEIFWGHKFYRLSPSHVCGEVEGAASPGYISALHFTEDRQIVEIDACTQKAEPLKNQGALEFSRDGILVGHAERLFQSRHDPKNAAEPYIEGFCTNSLVRDDSGQVTPVEMRLLATSQPTIASFSWLILGENYISLVTDGLKMTRAQSSSNRIYTSGPEGAGVSVDVSLIPDSTRYNTYPGSYRMENGVALDLYCRLAQ